MAEKEKLRIDKYLWSIRIFKTRRLATDACGSGKVKFDQTNVKAAKTVNIGDKYEIRTSEKKWVIEVVSLLHTRKGYEEAIKHYLDLTPPENIESVQSSAFVYNTGKRQSKQGRPTKKEKRKLDDLFGK
ncbi:MAG: RNA-binding S4 domain-containing protein [Ginsengibacter sp.]|jgi:ribosome-associated heat shock protein Hsp15